jgi:hypothetical protein
VRHDDVGEIIAERRLTLLDEPNRDVSIVIGRPTQIDGSDDFECRFQVRGLDAVRAAYGVDGVQALQEATFLLRAVLKRLLATHAGLRWLDGERGDFGLRAMTGITNVEQE